LKRDPGTTVKACIVCGNDIEDTEWQCPFCKSPQPSQATKGSFASPRKEQIRTVNLKEGLPVVEEALSRMRREISDARACRVKVLKLVHGYGSTGTGGKIKQAVQVELASMHLQGQIRMYVVGDDYAVSVAGQELRARYPELLRSRRQDFENRGITFVEL
tara:strand:- start:4 stop:483 length:480 start_codon:yes stop_codon:yes gene_type:complete